MASYTTNSHARSKSLRVPASNTVKPVSISTPQSSTGPSNIALFLTNLRILDLDLREDWPDITALTFSTKDSQQSQKKRIQCVEWALYQLFTLWDPEDARNKLQPFFPPLEPLQSLNLRTALFRCLDQAKKSGILGRDTVLRKTMLDECKGERLEEVLAVFSNAVLKKMLIERGSEEHAAIAQQLALENFSYTGERTILSTLIMVHKASLRKHLRDKDDVRAGFRDFADLLNLNSRRIVRRHEQLKQAIEEGGSDLQISDREVRSIQDGVRKNWVGNPQWLESILYGDSRTSGEVLLATRFDKVWKHIEGGTISDIEGQKEIGLFEQLDARVRDQENRLARWQDFGKTLSKAKDSSQSKKTAPENSVPQKIDLGFTRHQALQVGRENQAGQANPATVTLEEYTRLIENMKSEMAEVSKPQTATKRASFQSKLAERTSSPRTHSGDVEEDVSPDKDDAWSSVSENEGNSPGSISYGNKSSSHTPPSEVPAKAPRRREVDLSSTYKQASKVMTRSEVEYTPFVPRSPTSIRNQRSPSPKCRPQTPPRKEPPNTNKQLDSETELADEILNSVSAASPSPTKKPRHTLSLADRTRLSMSRASHSQYSDLHDDFEITDLPRLPIKTRPSMAPKTPSVEAEQGMHADLIERTRKSMAGFEAAQRKAQLERRRSVKDAKKKQRESSYFPKVEEEVVTPDISTIELLEGDPDYESVFKSRPKIKTSPAVSPTKIWEDNPVS